MLTKTLTVEHNITCSVFNIYALLCSAAYVVLKNQLTVTFLALNECSVQKDHKTFHLYLSYCCHERERYFTNLTSMFHFDFKDKSNVRETVGIYT